MFQRKGHWLKFCLLIILVIPFLTCNDRISAQTLSETTDCGCKSATTGPNYAGKTFKSYDFRTLGLDALKGACFRLAKLEGCRFDGMDLSDACFDAAMIISDGPDKWTSFSGANLTKTSFRGAILSYVDLQYANFNQTVFSEAVLENVKYGPELQIQGASDHRVLFRDAQINIGEDPYLFPLGDPTLAWSQIDFSGTRFVGLFPSKFQLSGHDMSDALLVGTNLVNFDLSKANLSNADLSKANLTAVNLDGANLVGATLIGANLSFASFKKAVFYQAGSKVANLSKATLSSAKFHEADLRSAILSGAALTNAEFRYAQMENSDLEAGETSTSLLHADFSFANLNRAVLDQVSFENAMLVHTQFQNTTLQGTNFNGAIMPHSNFNQSILEDVSFNGAILNDANFTSAKLTGTATGMGVDFSCSQLGGADFSSAAIDKVNFNNATIPPASACCPQESGVYCGQIPWTGTSYGKTTLPQLKGPVTCPNSEVAMCKGQQWQIRNWETSACDPDGRREKRWVKPICNQKHGPVVYIPDAALSACIAKQIYGSTGGPITKAIAAALANLACPDAGIRDLTGLEYFTALTSLDLSGNALSNGDFSNLSSALVSLHVDNNQLTSLNFGEMQLALLYLDASFNNIQEISGTTNIYFQYLDLSHNKLAGVWPMSAQTSLVYLDMSYNQLTSVGTLSGLTQASTIFLENNQLTEIGSLAALYQNGKGVLWNLDLAQNPHFQCQTLQVPQVFLQAANCK